MYKYKIRQHLPTLTRAINLKYKNYLVQASVQPKCVNKYRQNVLKTDWLTNNSTHPSITQDI